MTLSKLREAVDEMLADGFDATDLFSDMLAALLDEGVCFISSYNDKTKQHDDGIHIAVGCSDTFAYSTADAEHIGYKDIFDIYRVSVHNWGTERWCALRRGTRPLPGIEEKMRHYGVWDAELESLPKIIEHGERGQS